MTELYVWPPFRRQGIGGRLVRQAMMDAIGWGDSRLHLVCQEADLALSTSVAYEAAMGIGARWEPPEPNWAGAAQHRWSEALKRDDPSTFEIGRAILQGRCQWYSFYRQA